MQADTLVYHQVLPSKHETLNQCGLRLGQRRNTKALLVQRLVYLTAQLIRNVGPECCLKIMLGQRRRRRSGIRTTLGRRPVLDW